jgi:hypothetical protein
MPRTRKREYLPLEHLALSIFLDNAQDRCPMAMFTAYFDDSGSPDQGVCLTVAGYVSTVEKWIRFEKEWRAILYENDIEYFHMKEYAHSVGQFKKWKGKEGKRKIFLKRLVACVKKTAHKSFSSAALLKEYNEMDALYPLHEAAGYPFAMCGRSCAAKINRWRQRNNIAEPIELIFESGTKHAADLFRVLKRDGLPLPIFKDKKEFGALQAADFVAWEHTKALTGLHLGTIKGLKDIRKSLAALNSIPNDWGVQTRNDLEVSCQMIGLPLRSTLSQAGMVIDL